MLGKFIYIIDSSLYLKFLKNSMYKFVPNSLLFKFQHKISPRIVCKYIETKKDSLVGYGIGILCNCRDIGKEEFIEKVILSIEQLELQEVDTLIMNIDNLSLEDIKRIQDACNIRIPTGTETLLELFTHILSRICNEASLDLREQEVLIICDDTWKTKKVITKLSENVKFLTVFSEDKEYVSDIKEEILSTCGLSLYSTDNINRGLSNCNIIINLSNNIYLDLEKIKRKTVVLDLSSSKKLKESIKSKRKDIMCIDDIVFKNSTSIKSDPGGYGFNPEIDSHIYEVISDIKSEDFIKIKINGKSYYIYEALDLYFNKNYKKTVFKVK